MLPAIRAIRATNPRRLLIVDSVFWADPTKLSTLTLPDDANIMASIHLYEPKLFTFQGQDWMGPAYLTTGVIFPGPPATPINPVQAAKDASWANQWFIDYNTKPAATNPSGPATVTAQIALITAYRQAPGARRLQRRVGPAGWRRAGLARPAGDDGPPAVRKRGHRVGDLGRPRRT